MTSVRAHMPAYGSLHFFRNAPVRTGVYVGVCLSIALMTWVVIANNLAFLYPYAFLRNWAALALLVLIAAIPVLRFWRYPGNLLASGLVGWLILSTTYRFLCLRFRGLEQRMSAVQIFVLGMVVYLLVVSISWIATIIRRARAAERSTPRHDEGHSE